MFLRLLFPFSSNDLLSESGALLAMCLAHSHRGARSPKPRRVLCGMPGGPERLPPSFPFSLAYRSVREDFRLPAIPTWVGKSIPRSPEEFNLKRASVPTRSPVRRPNFRTPSCIALGVPCVLLQGSEESSRLHSLFLRLAQRCSLPGFFPPP